jgi:hypothetical protein
MGANLFLKNLQLKKYVGVFFFVVSPYMLFIVYTLRQHRTITMWNDAGRS